MSKYFVSGAAGFVSSHLIDALLETEDNYVVGYDNLFKGKLANISHHFKNKRFKFIKGDIRDYKKLNRTIEGCDTIFHLAAQSNVIGSAENPDYCFQTNVLGTYNMLKASLNAKVRNFVFSSSREVYGDSEDFPVKETTPYRGKNTYAASKISGEIWCNSFRDVYGLNTNILRFSNVYGERDYGRVIPDWINKAKRKEHGIIYGGNQILDFVYVKYVVQALIAASSQNNNFPINVGSGQSTSIFELAKYFNDVLGLKFNYNLLPARNLEVLGYVADTTRMRNILNVIPPKDSLEDIKRLL